MKTMRTLTFLLGILLVAQVSAQVTIGSSKQNMSGALLDLKDEGTYTNGETANRGLGLPRVKLTKINPTTDNELAASIGNATGEYNREAHTGLVVYNSNPEGCMPEIDIYPPLPGSYVWTGDKWQLLNKVVEDVRSVSYGQESVGANGIRVGTLTMSFNNGTDPAEAESYPYAYFGDAGVWMTQNLRTQYTPNGTKLSMTGSQTSNGKDASGKPQKVGAYPRSVNPTLSDFYNENRAAGIELGLLYDWYTATDHHNCSNADQDQKGLLGSVPGLLEVETKEEKGFIKGICPAGWHLPSDREWTSLEKELTEKASKYATGTYSGAEITWSTAWETTITGWRSLVTGTIMKSVVNPLHNTYSSAGESKDARVGGFDVILVGDAEDGTSHNYSSGASFWSSSSYTNQYNTVALARNYNYSRVEYYRGAFNRKTFYSVRCKKN